MLNTEKFAELYVEVAAERGETITKKDARARIDLFAETAVKAVAEHEGFDIYQYFGIEVKPTSERAGRNPKTGEELTIPAGKKTSLKRNKNLKEALK